jgi:hypothetical protein
MMNGSKHVIPPIKRCREYHLYDYKGNRYLDMILDEGRALMGHKPGKTMLAIKNSLEKGLWTPYPSIYTHRLKKLLGTIFPHYSEFALFSNEERVALALDSPLIDLPSWQPLGGEEDNSHQRLIITPLLPGIQTVIVASQSKLPQEDSISPFILEGLIRNFHDYLKFKEDFDQKIWNHFDQFEKWERKGPVLSFKGTPEEYGTLFIKGLENKILLPCTSEKPARIPSQLSNYELECINRVFNSGEST